MLGRVTLTIPASPSTAAMADAVAATFAAEAGIPAEGADRLRRAVGCLVAFSVEQSYEGRTGGDVEVSIELDQAGVAVDVHDWGRPFRVAGGTHGPLPAALEAAEAIAEDVRLINLGGEGKRLTLHIATPHAIPIAPVVDGAADSDRAARVAADGGIEIRDATLEDADEIARLLYRGYGLGYVHGDFYRPAWIEQAMRDGHVSSTVAYAGDELIGHHALLLAGEGEAAESGVAVIAREWRGLGLFDRMFSCTVDRARRLGIPALFGQATTAHVYSQRSEFKSGYHPTALLIGAAPAAMAQAQSGSGDAPVGRGALLNSVLPLAAQPQIVAAPPERYARVIDRIASEAGFAPAAVRRRDPLPMDEELAYYSEGNVTLLHVSGGSDPKRVERMLWSEEARRAGTLYADIDLSCPCDASLELLREQGFYLSGLIHAGRGGRDWLRLQRPQDAADLDQLHLEGDLANWLFAEIVADRDSLS